MELRAKHLKKRNSNFQDTQKTGVLYSIEISVVSPKQCEHTDTLIICSIDLLRCTTERLWIQSLKFYHFEAVEPIIFLLN